MDYEAIHKTLQYELTKLGYPDDAEDATQDFFLRKLEGKSAKQAIRFHAQDYLDRTYGSSGFGKRLHPSQSVTFEDTHFDNEIDQTEQVFKKEIIERSLAIIEQFKPKYIDLFKHIYLSNLNLTEIAQMYKVSASLVSRKASELELILCKYLVNAYPLSRSSKMYRH